MTDAAFPYTWDALLMVEGEPTSDGRLVAPGALKWPDEPIPLVRAFGGDIIGRVSEIWRDGKEIHASGVADRPLKGDGAAIGATVGSYSIMDATFSTEIAPFTADAGFMITDGEIRSVAAVSTPAVERARFTDAAERPVCEGECGEVIPAGVGYVLLELVTEMKGPGDRLFIPHRTSAVVCGPCYANGRWTRDAIGSSFTRFYARGETPAPARP